MTFDQFSILYIPELSQLSVLIMCVNVSLIIGDMKGRWQPQLP